MTHRLAILALPLLLAACAVGPDFDAPPPPAADSLGPPPVEAEGLHFRSQADVAADWWRLYSSPALDRLVRQALANNPDLAAAQAALKVAQEAAAANHGVFYPTLQGSIQALRQKDPTAAVAPTAANNAPQLTLFTPQVTVSYSPDLWGGYRRGQETLEAQTEAQLFQTEATTQTLIGNLVVAAIGEASLRGQVAAAGRIVMLQGESLDILRHQLRLGQVADSDVLAQETALAQAEQTLAPLAKQLEMQRHLLAALVGRAPAEAPGEIFEVGDLRLPGELPLALPGQLVERRPDIRMAQANLQAASAQIGVAIANRLPNVTLDAALGSSATRIQDLFTAGNGQWNFGAMLTQPLFDGFSLLHKERQARAAYDQAAAQYRSTVIAAFQNVADSLSALKYDGDALRAARAADQAAWRGVEIARTQYRLGQIAYLTLAAVESAAQQARIALVQAEAGQLQDSAALLQALGGGWWNRANLT